MSEPLAVQDTCPRHPFADFRGELPVVLERGNGTGPLSQPLRARAEAGPIRGRRRSDPRQPLRRGAGVPEQLLRTCSTRRSSCAGDSRAQHVLCAFGAFFKCQAQRRRHLRLLLLPTGESECRTSTTLSTAPSLSPLRCAVAAQDRHLAEEVARREHRGLPHDRPRRKRRRREGRRNT